MRHPRGQRRIAATVRGTLGGQLWRRGSCATAAGRRIGGSGEILSARASQAHVLPAAVRTPERAAAPAAAAVDSGDPANACAGSPGAGAPLRRRPFPRAAPAAAFACPDRNLRPGRHAAADAGERRLLPFRDSGISPSARGMPSTDDSSDSVAASARFLACFASDERSAAMNRCGRSAWLMRRQFDSESRERFFGLLPPVGATKSLRRNRVPVSRFFFMFGFLFNSAELPRNHCVARALIEFVEFRLRVGAVFRLADARLDLPPISHVGAL